MEFKKYKVKGKLFSIFGKYEIRDEHDHIVYTAKSNFLQTKVPLIDDLGHEVLVIKRKLFALRYTYFIEKRGEPLFKVVKTLGLKPTVFIESLSQPDAFLVEGNIWGTEYAFYKEDEEFAYVSGKMFNLPGLYGVAIKDGEDKDAVLALVLIIDLIKRDKRRRRS